MPVSLDAWLWSGSPSGVKLKDECSRYARSPDPLLIWGEPGTGKSLLASVIHSMSGRRGEFVAVRSGELPEQLEQAELLGHVRGAFTGADRDRKGLVESARQGTLFLDEIGIARSSLQQLCLQLTARNPVIRPVGAARSISLDVRLVAATNEDLRTAVREGRFRRDLLDRFGWSVIRLAPLRERPEEILPLADSFLAAAAAELGIGPVRLAPSLRDHFRRAGWSGNIRHLQQVCGRIALFHSDEQPVALDHLPEGLCEVSSPFDVTSDRPLRIDLVRSALERHDGNRTRAARELGCSVRTIQRAVNSPVGPSRNPGNP